MSNKKVFISYSWESDEHKEWVHRLADYLEEFPDIHVVWDMYDLDSSSDKNKFMEEAVYDVDYMLIVATKKYKEKADSRNGGVGIETYLNTAKHWYDLQNESNQQSHSIVLQKDKDSTPRYLAGHFHIDFTNDNFFEQNCILLLKQINGQQKISRPVKGNTPSATTKKNYKLTKASELISIKFPSRNIIVSEQEGTDFKSGKRIKFEIWSSSQFFPLTIVLLHPNINMRQTLECIAATIEKRVIRIDNLLVLSETSKRNTLLSILKSLTPSRFGAVKAQEVTYSEYIWKDCLDDEFKKIEIPDQTDCYIPQQIEKEGEIHDSATSLLNNSLKEKSDYICHLLIGGGGIGKSSLCSALVVALSEEDNIPFLISSEEIRNYTEENDFNPDFIHSIYELYEIQSKCNEHRNTMGRKLFNLALLSGNITIIIDGLDEFPSIFGSKFDTQIFLESVSEIHSELGSSKILITSRDQKFLEHDEIKNLNINTFELLGFTEQACKKYIRKRFKEHDDSIEIGKVIFNKFRNSSFSDNERIVPFFAEVLCNLYDDIENIDGLKGELLNSELPYQCLKTLTDEIIYSVFIREEIRQSYPISAFEMFEIFCTFSAKYGKNWELANVTLDLKMSYDENEKYKLIENAIQINPLILKRNNNYTLKYDFTLSYFHHIYMIENIINASVTGEALQLLAKTNFESTTFFDLKDYFKKSTYDITEKAINLINNIKSISTTALNSNLQNISIIEFLFFLSFSVKNANTKEKLTYLIKKFFQSGGGNCIDNCYIKGDFPPLDFSNLTISNSRFKDYPNFLKSNFSTSKFLYSRFVNCGNEEIHNSNILTSDIDKDSCDLGNLKSAIDKCVSRDSLNSGIIEKECRKFLRSFTKGQGFKNNKKDLVKFSQIIQGLQPIKFKNLVKEGFLTISNEKEADNLYALSPNFKNCARKFILNGTKSSNIRKFIEFVS